MNAAPAALSHRSLDRCVRIATRRATTGWLSRLPLVAFSVLVASPALAGLPPAPAGVEVTTSQGIEFVTVGAANNPAFMTNDPLDLIGGRGSVAYEYRIGRTEISTAQWLEFVNTFVDRVANPFSFASPGIWGARRVLFSNRWELDPSIPNAEMAPVMGISWREAAMYCNWLHNDKSTSLEAIRSGAYDVSTFTTNPDNSLNDQRTHSPGARFWIPTRDEWLKAAHFDPNRYGEGQPGWWAYSHRSDEAPVPGLPGVGQTTAELSLPDLGQLYIPLGSYANVQSPWGLLDTSGGAAEWNEEVLFPEFFTGRGLDGSWAGISSGSDPLDYDRITSFTGFGPQAGGVWEGLRIASTVPGPGSAMALLVLGGMACAGRNRRGRAVG